MIYLDYAASTPMSDLALKVYTKTAQTYFGNSMSLHDTGTDTSDLLTYCREKVTTRLNAEEDSVVFSSGGSESNWLALYGLAMGNRAKGQHILVGKGAHGSVKSSLEWLVEQGFRVEEIPADSKGKIQLSKIESLVQPDTCLVVLAHVNSEFGFLTEIETIGNFLAAKGISFHVDAVQSFGKHPVDVEAFQVSSLAFSSHKIYGPKGVGGLYVNPDVAFEPFLPSVSHELGRRQGTVNVPGIAAFTEAMEEAFDHRTDHYDHVMKIKSYFVERIRNAQLPIVSESPMDETSPYILALRVLGLEGQYVMLEANRRGVAISTGSACSVSKKTPSSILLAMGRSVEEARQVIRLSFGPTTRFEEIDQAVDVLSDIIKRATSFVQ